MQTLGVLFLSIGSIVFALIGGYCVKAGMATTAYIITCVIGAIVALYAYKMSDDIEDTDA